MTSSDPHLSAATAFDGAPWGVVSVDEDGRVRYMNAGARQLLGTGDADGLVLAELLDGRLGEDDKQALRAALATGRADALGLNLQAEGGRLKHLRLTAADWQAGDERWRLLYLVDDTARHQAEEGRRSSEASLLTFLGRSPEPAVVHASGAVLHVNQAVTEALGYDDPRELIGRSLLELTHPEDRALVKERVARMLRTHEPLPVKEERFLRRNGSTFHAEVFAIPVMLEGRIAFLAWGRDLSESKRADAERQQLLAERTRLMEDARRHAAELEAILDNMLTGVFVCDTSGRLTLANEAGARILGCRSVLELVGLTLDELAARFDIRDMNGKPLQTATLALSRALEGETIGIQDTRITLDHADETHYMRSSAGPIRNAQGETVAAVQVFRDHTDVVEFNRLKDQFLRVVAHELKTPLAIMQGYTELMARDPGAAGRIDTVGAIRRGAARIERIVADMASLTGVLERELPLSLAPLQLDLLVRQLVASMMLIHKKHSFTLDVAPVVVPGDRAQLEQVVQRLLDNAVRYSPRGGNVSVTLAHDGVTARLSVADEGVGIPAAKQQSIFQRFYRAHTDTPHDYGGLGIGLSLSREVVKLHGGRIHFQSTEGQGSTFHVELPVMGRDD